MEFGSKCRLAPAHTVLDHSSRLWHFPMDSKATFTPLISSKKNLRKLKTKLDIDGSVSHRHCDCLSFSVVQNDTHRISHRPSIRYEIFMHFKFLDSFFSGLFCSRTTHSLEVWLQLLLLCCQMPGTRALTIHSHSIFYSSAYWPAYTKKQKSQMQLKYILHVVTHSIISVTNFCRSASQARQHAHTRDPQRATLCQPQLTTLCEYSSCRNLPRESVRQARTAQMFIFVSSMSQICVFFPFYFLCKSLNGRGLRKRGISLANHTHARAKKKRRKANTKYCLIEHTFLSIVRSSILRFAYVGSKNIARNCVYVCVVNI